MPYILPLLTFAIPAIGMTAGLAAAPLITCLFLFLFYELRYSYSAGISTHYLFAEWKTEIIFAIWVLISCFWSSDIAASLTLYGQIFIPALLVIILWSNLGKLQSASSSIAKALFLGIIAAIVIFFVEYSSNGLISYNFRALFQPDPKYYFALHNLDRGCALLAISSWVVIAKVKQYDSLFSRTLLKIPSYIVAVIFYLIILYLLSLSDSLASFVGFAIAGIAYLVISYNTKLARLINLAVVLGSLCMPVIAYHIAPREISDRYTIPDSAKHRLFIWNFVVNKALDQPLIGKGLGASKNIPISASDTIEYNDYRWSPLPLHPHNNLLQVFLETGLIGLLLFIALFYKWLQKISCHIEQKSAFARAAHAALITYYIIGMISFSVWQAWWICTGLWVAVILKLLDIERKSTALDASYERLI